MLNMISPGGFTNLEKVIFHSSTEVSLPKAQCIFTTELTMTGRSTTVPLDQPYDSDEHESLQQPAPTLTQKDQDPENNNAQNGLWQREINTEETH
jgi:hypothetical protein